MRTLLEILTDLEVQSKALNTEQRKLVQVQSKHASGLDELIHEMMASLANGSLHRLRIKSGQSFK